jgi:type IV secretory pathway VirJ component
VVLPKVGHGFSVTKNWMPQFTEAYKRIISLHEEKKANLNAKATELGVVKPKDLEHLPLKIIPSAKSSKTMVFMISGDGGWTGFDQQLAEHLAAQGYPVVGLDALQYFWSAKTPEGVIKDITPVLNHYLGEWHCEQFVLMGYSFGANVVPFLVNRFSPEIRSKVKIIALMSPDEKADFEIHISDMINIFGERGDYNVKSEMLKMKEKALLIFGSDEASKFDDLPKKQFKQITISGGHHYGDNFDALANGIVGAAKE